MKINITSTSNNVILFLEKQGHKLTQDEKDHIHVEIFDALVAASEEESNGCDCGQMGCPICNP